MMNDKQSLDKTTDDILTYAAMLADREIGEKLDEPDEEIVFSKEHEDKMKRLFRKEWRKQSAKIFSKYAQRAACVLLVVIIGSGVAIYSVEAWRIKFLNFVLEIGQPNTDFNFSDNGGSSYSDDDITLEYVPMGFEMTDSYSTRQKVFLTFTSGEKYFQIVISDINSNSSIDTENGTIEKADVNGYEAVYTTNKNINALIWHNNELVFRIAGNIPKEEILKIAENIKK